MAKAKKKPARVAARKVKPKPTARQRVKAHRAKLAAVEPANAAAQVRWPVASIKIGVRHRKDYGDIDALAHSINERGGLLQPVVVTPGRKLIAGERRILAWKKSRFAKSAIPVSIIDVDSIVAGEWDENAVRKDFTHSEAVAIKRELEPLERAKAILRQREHGGSAPGRAGAPAEASGRAADKVAAVLGRDRKTLSKAEQIVDAADRDPAQFGKLKEDMDRTGKVDGPFKRLQVIVQSAAIRKEPPPLPNRGPYRTIVADVPWPAEPDDPSPAERGRGYYNYPTMSIAELVAMGPGVQSIAHKDAWLWFWVPNFHAARGLHVEIIRAWGFEPSTIRAWKKNKVGRGQILRGQTELCVVARRGKPVINLKNETTWFEGKVRGDSEKPAEFYADVERLCPAPRYAELFSRRKMPDNWDGHGDQVGKLGGAEATAWQAAHAVKSPIVTVTTENELPGNFIEIIAAKAAAGEIAWSADPANGKASLKGSIAWFGGSDFRNMEITSPMPKGFAGGIPVYRNRSRIEVGSYTDDSGCGWVASCIPVGKLKALLGAWARAITAAPAAPAKVAA